jgi:hypothetical protein
MTHLCLIHVGVSDSLKHLVLKRARLALQLSKLRGRQVVAIVNVPGSTMGNGWPPGVQLTRPLDYLSAEDLAQVDEWTRTASTAATQGPGRDLFPVICGVSLADLNLLDLQVKLRLYGRLSRALLGAVRITGAQRVSLFSTWAELVQALQQQLRPHVGGRISAWAPESNRLVRAGGVLLRRSVRRAARPKPLPPLSAVSELAARRGPVRTVLVSWSAPMTGTLESVEAALSHHALTPSFRLQFSDPSSMPQEIHPDTWSWRLGQPGSVFAAVDSHVVDWAKRIPKGSVNAPDLSNEGAELVHNSEFVRSSIRRLASAEFVRQARHVATARDLLDRLRPEVLVVGNDRWWVGQAMVRLAKKCGIPTVCVQDGVATDDMPEWQWLAADRIALIGSNLGEILERRGVARNRWEVTGQPRYDALVQRRGDGVRVQVRMSIGLQPDLRYVLFATQGHQDPAFVQQVVDALLAVPDIHVLLRPHPSESHSFHRKLVERRSGAPLSLYAHESIDDLVTAADLVVIQSSTVALDAAAIGRPIISVSFDGQERPYLAWLRHTARSPKELTRVVTDIARRGFQDPPAADGWGEHMLQSYLGPVDGKASDRVARFISEASKSAEVPS